MCGCGCESSQLAWCTLLAAWMQIVGGFRFVVYCFGCDLHRDYCSGGGSKRPAPCVGSNCAWIGCCFVRHWTARWLRQGDLHRCFGHGALCSAEGLPTAAADTSCVQHLHHSGLAAGSYCALCMHHSSFRVASMVDNCMVFLSLSCPYKRWWGIVLPKQVCVSFHVPGETRK